MTIDEAIKNLEYGIEQMTMELKSGLWETGSDTEAQVKQGIELNQQLIAWLTELKQWRRVYGVCPSYEMCIPECKEGYNAQIAEYKRLLKSATNVLNMFIPCDEDYNCRECIKQRQNCDYDDSFKWRYADEAKNLLNDKK